MLASYKRGSPVFPQPKTQRPRPNSGQNWAGHEIDLEQEIFRRKVQLDYAYGEPNLAHEELNIYAGALPTSFAPNGRGGSAVYGEGTALSCTAQPYALALARQLWVLRSHTPTGGGPKEGESFLNLLHDVGPQT